MFLFIYPITFAFSPFQTINHANRILFSISPFQRAVLLLRSCSITAGLRPNRHHCQRANHGTRLWAMENLRNAV